MRRLAATPSLNSANKLIDPTPRLNHRAARPQVVMRDRATGRPRGFGFVTYRDPGVVERVVREVHIVDGRQVSSCFVARQPPLRPNRAAIRAAPNLAAAHAINSPPQIDVKRSVPQEQKPKARKIFVGGLAPETDEGAPLGGASSAPRLKLN